MQDWQKKLQQLQAWWQTPLGQTLLDIEKRYLAEHLATTFGYQLVLIADESFASLSNHSRMSQVLRIDPLTESVDNLPENMDAIIIPHSLSYVPNPQLWLQAIHNKLDSNGIIVLTAFQYLSYLGLQKAMLAKNVRALPAEVNNFSYLRSALLSNEFSLIDSDRFAAGSLSCTDKNDNKVMKQSYFGNLICITARKKLATVKNIETDWTNKAANSQAALNSCIGENRKHER